MATLDTGRVSAAADDPKFAAVTAPWREELLGHAYRMLGSWDEAEDAVQESYLRAWSGWAAFEGRASVRTWLHRILANVCLSSLSGRRRRALPSGLDPLGPGAPETLPSQTWIQPVAERRDDLRLALVAALQLLPPSQRAALVLREALGFSAVEAAAILELSVPALKSLLQRARSRIAGARPAPGDVVEPESATARRLLTAYVDAFERAEVDLLVAVLRADARLELPPSPRWYDGRAACVAVFRAAVGHPGDWRMVPTIANGQPAVTAYLHGLPFGIAVLDARGDGLAGVTVFAEPALVPRFQPTD